ncbi:MAG TPA: hypothetical protein VLT36_15755 [Candidatus Dormibacteraeota bacterium]|nr:hypothetical protein [Candidatus Dormibacteraeota bacterium]
MNTENFKKSVDGFEAPDLRVKFFFKTASSIGFDLAMERFHGTILGGMQVHHPCEGHIKARLYIQLPKKFRDHNLLDQLRIRTFNALRIPLDETYELEFRGAEDGLIIGQPVDRNGITDRV